MKEPITITVLADQELLPFINEFTKSGGIYTNINSGLLQEPWIPNYLSILLDSSIICIGGINYAGSDFIDVSTNKKIEHKSAVIQNNTAELTNLGEIKKESDYISFFIRTTSMLYIVPTFVIMDLCELRLTGKKQRLPFKVNMIVDDKNKRLSNNTRILNEYIKSMNIKTLEIFKI
jgi:hypothetical protein